MRKVSILLIIMTLSAFAGFSQKDKYDDLRLYLVDEKFEKVLYKAEPYTQNDKYKKDPEPYLYLSMAYFEISKRGEYAEDYPKAFKNSLKYAVKYAKKDKEKRYFDENDVFFAELRDVAMDNALSELDNEKYSKAKTIYKNLIAIDQNEVGAWILRGYAEEMIKAKKDAALSYSTAKELLDGNACADHTKEQTKLLKVAIITVAEHLDEAGRGSEAKDWLESGLDQFKDDKEYMVTYNMIAG